MERLVDQPAQPVPVFPDDRFPHAEAHVLAAAELLVEEALAAAADTAAPLGVGLLPQNADGVDLPQQLDLIRLADGVADGGPLPESSLDRFGPVHGVPLSSYEDPPSPTVPPQWIGRGRTTRRGGTGTTGGR